MPEAVPEGVANYESPCTTKLYDRTNDAVTWMKLNGFLSSGVYGTPGATFLLEGDTRMFRDGRRKKQFMSKEATEEILNRGLAGVLGVNGDDGYPYTVPISYVYDSGKIYLHSANSGHKLDSVRRNDKVSFCVIDQNQVVPEELTTYYRSAIVFGRARIVEDETVKRHALELLGQKYSANYREKTATSISKQWDAVSVVEIVVEHMSGKEAIELVAMS